MFFLDCRDALGPQVVFLQRSSKATQVDRALAEQEAFSPRNQADAARNLDDVGATR
jgi:hypothetical protein